jgi:hypothetical protein
MKQYRFVLFFVTVLALAALACNGGRTPTSAPPQAAPTSVQPPKDATQAAPQDNGDSNSSGDSTTNSKQLGSNSDPVTFTDSNNLYSFELPGDWTYENSFNEDDGIYVDHFESPDTTGFIENITGFSEDPLTGNSNGKVALYFIHKYYSNTGAEGDIRISGDQIQSDGSERLDWKSKSGGYSGMSYFEVRGDDRKTFLMFTVWWSNATPQEVIDTIQGAIKTYRVP